MLVMLFFLENICCFKLHVLMTNMFCCSYVVILKTLTWTFYLFNYELY